MKKIKIQAYIDLDATIEFKDNATEDEIEEAIAHYVDERLSIICEEVE